VEFVAVFFGLAKQLPTTLRVRMDPLLEEMTK